MKYPLDVEVCVKVYIEEEGYKEAAVKYMRDYVAMLNAFYEDGLNSPVTANAEETFNIITHHFPFRERFKGNFDRFLTQIKDAYYQGVIDSGKDTGALHTEGKIALA